MARERITTKKLAELCGVSLGTIDRALNNRPGIRESTRERVLAAAAEYGYKPNHIGRSLQSGRTMDIGVVVHDLDNRFFSQLVNAIQQDAWERGYFIQLAVTLRDPQREKAVLEHMIERNVDGILLFPAGKEEELGQYLSSLPLPVVAIGNALFPEGCCSLVGLDDRTLIDQATQAAIQRGYTRLGFVAPYLKTSQHLNNFEAEERLNGFLAAAQKAGVDSFVLDDWDYLQQLEQVPWKKAQTALICTSDIFALEVVNQLHQLGLSIPQDVGVMGFDDIDILRYASTALTTVRYPVGEIGRMAVRRLLQEMDDATLTPEKVSLDSRIIWRDSL